MCQAGGKGVQRSDMTAATGGRGIIDGGSNYIEGCTKCSAQAAGGRDKWKGENHKFTNKKNQIRERARMRERSRRQVKPFAHMAVGWSWRGVGNGRVQHLTWESKSR